MLLMPDALFRFGPIYLYICFDSENENLFVQLCVCDCFVCEHCEIIFFERLLHINIYTQYTHTHTKLYLLVIVLNYFQNCLCGERMRRFGGYSALGADPTLFLCLLDSFIIGLQILVLATIPHPDTSNVSFD